MIPYSAPLPQLAVVAAGHTTRLQIHLARMVDQEEAVRIPQAALHLRIPAALAVLVTLQTLRHLKVLTVAQEMERNQTLAVAVAAAHLLRGQQEHQQLAATVARELRLAFLALA
jgi:hypothetical protein